MAEYDVIADYYDELFQDRTVDIIFWVTIAKKIGLPILELACGTGRLTFPIARAGIEVVGIDVSRRMLQRAREKMKRESYSTRRNVSFREHNVFSFFIPNKSFRGILAPWGFLPTTEEEQQGLFNSVKRHLQPDGYFVVDIENEQEHTEDWSYYRVKEYKHIPGKYTLIRHVFSTGQAKTKLSIKHYFLDVVDTKGNIRRLVTERNYRHYTKEDMMKLLGHHGFTIESIYGNYDFSPWSENAERTIFVARLFSVNSWREWYSKIKLRF